MSKRVATKQQLRESKRRLRQTRKCQRKLINQTRRKRKILATKASEFFTTHAKLPKQLEADEKSTFMFKREIMRVEKFGVHPTYRHKRFSRESSAKEYESNVRDWENDVTRDFLKAHNAKWKQQKDSISV